MSHWLVDRLAEYGPVTMRLTEQHSLPPGKGDGMITLCRAEPRAAGGTLYCCVIPRADIDVIAALSQLLSPYSPLADPADDGQTMPQDPP